MADVITVRSPFDGEVVGEVPSCDASALDAAVATASRLLDAGLAQHRRAEVLEAAARALADDDVREHLARTIAAEAAKPIRQARVEAARAAGTFTYAAVAARTLTGEVVPLEGTEVGAGKIGFTLRVPVGVVGAITPFNFPLNLVAHKVAPAIAAGCPIVVKPASQTPLSALALRDLLVERCDLPEGWVQVVAGPGREVGAALVGHDDVAMLTFTGSGEVGWQLRSSAPRKRVSLELGNSTPLVVDAGSDWEVAAEKVAAGGYAHAGQSCISVQRVLVHEDVHEGFVDALRSHVERLVVGDPMDDATDLSSLISTDDRDRVRSWVDEAVEGGARLVTGGDVDGPLLRPVVLDGARPDMRVCRDEVFGPVVSVQAVGSFEEGLRLADDTRYGLQAAVFTPDLGRALEAARRLHFGGVLVNEVPTWRADQMPYGGVRASGNTKEGPLHAVRDMTEERLVVLQA